MKENDLTMNTKEIEAAIGILKLSKYDQKGIKAGRLTRKTALQTSILNSIFSISQYPSTRTIIDLGLLINIHPRSIQKWFQNMRQSTKRKKLNKTYTQDPSDSDSYSYNLIKENILGSLDDGEILDIPVLLLANIVNNETQKFRNK